MKQNYLNLKLMPRERVDHCGSKTQTFIPRIIFKTLVYKMIVEGMSYICYS